MTKDNFDNMSVEQIIRQIEEYHDDTEVSIYEISRRLVSLRNKKAGHRLFTHPIYKHYERIASKRILPGLVVLYSSDKDLLDRLSNLTKPVQQQILDGNTFTVAVLQKGEIVEVKKTVTQLRKAAIKRLFPDSGGVATFSQQRDELQREIDNTPPPVARVRADVKERVILVGKSRVSLAELKGALSDLGLTIGPAK